MLGPRAILIADDEESVRLLLHALLERDSCTVLVASDGRHALEVARGYAGEIHALVADYKMPHMDGVELAKAIIAERPGIRVLMISGRISKPEELAKCRIPVIRKPFTISAFMESLRQCLEGPPPTAGN